MRIPHIISLLLVVFLVSCQDNREVTYYENGNVKLEVDLKEGIRNGKSTEYYEDGSIKSKALWSNDKLNGQATYYYNNGIVKSVVNWKENQKVGKAEYFYETGQIKSKCNYLNDTLMTGEVLNYSESGGIIERKIYSEDGKLAYIEDHSDEGKPKGTVLPLIYPYKKVVAPGESYSGKIKFGFNLTGDIAIELGHINSVPTFVKDTVIYAGGEGNYSFTIKNPKKLGKNTVAIRIKHETTDTLSADGVIIQHVFYVDSTASMI